MQANPARLCEQTLQLLLTYFIDIVIASNSESRTRIDATRNDGVIVLRTTAKRHPSV